MGKATFSFKAYLDNGETADVIYDSDYYSESCILNDIKSIIYRGVDIIPVLKYESSYDIPFGIYNATENNSQNMWFQIIHTPKQVS